MKILEANWWTYLHLVCFFNTQWGPQKTRGYQIPTFGDVVSNATYINGPPILDPPEQYILETSSSRQLLLPWMNFTCNGTISRIMYIGWLSGSDDATTVTSRPLFSLWHPGSEQGSFRRVNAIGPSETDSEQQMNQLVLTEVNLMGRVRFNEGDILGIRAQRNRPPASNGNTLTVLKQLLSYGLTVSCDNNSWCSQPIVTVVQQEMPYIAVETDPPAQQCALGFLNKQSLWLIWNASRNSQASNSLYLPGIPPVSTSMPLTQSGSLRKLIIAASFYIDVLVGWPELQIMRRASNGTSYVAFTTNKTEPKPTGYLNVYEYDLSGKIFEVQANDTLNISWNGDDLNSIRFDLSYYHHNATSPGIPMVSIVVGNCTSDTDLLTLNTLYCEQVTQPTTSSITEVVDAATIRVPISTFIKRASSTVSNQNHAKGKLITVSTSVVISVVASCSLLVTVVGIIMVFVVRHHKTKVKKSSTEVSDSEVQCSSTEEVIEMDINEAYISNTQIPIEPNIAYSTIGPELAEGQTIIPRDYDYVIL